MHISEAELEDWAEANPEDVTRQPGAITLGRQMTLPSGGRIDLLFMHTERDPRRIVLWVAELKREKADAATIMQVQRYMGELRKPWNGVEVRGIIVAPIIPGDVETAIAGNPLLYACTVDLKVSFRGASQMDASPYWAEVQETLDPLLADAFKLFRLRDRFSAVVRWQDTPERVLASALQSQNGTR